MFKSVTFEKLHGLGEISMTDPNRSGAAAWCNDAIFNKSRHGPSRYGQAHGLRQYRPCAISTRQKRRQILRMNGLKCSSFWKHTETFDASDSPCRWNTPRSIGWGSHCPRSNERVVSLVCTGGHSALLLRHAGAMRIDGGLSRILCRKPLQLVIDWRRDGPTIDGWKKVPGGSDLNRRHKPALSARPFGWRRGHR
jgi:hypothetical protein